MKSPLSLPVFFSLLVAASAHAAITITPADSAPLKFAATEIDVRTPTYSQGEWPDSERLNVSEM